MAYKETGVTKMLMGKSGGLRKPSFEVSVYAPTGRPSSVDDTKYLKEDLAREKKEIAGYERILENWVPEEVAAKAEAEVERKLAECKLRVKELRGRIKLRSKKEGK